MTTPPRESPSGWSTPMIIVAILSVVASSVGTWVGISRDDSNALQGRINAVEREISELKRDVLWLRRERAGHGD